MRQLVLTVPIDRGHDYCTVIQESEAIQLLQCMSDLGIKAYVEYDEIPSKCEVPKHFDWVNFITNYRRILKYKRGL